MRANAKGSYTERSGYDKYGEPLFTGASLTLVCAVVSLMGKMQKTPVRTNTSGSQSNADEDTEMANILFPPGFVPAVGARFEIYGVTLRFVSVMPRINTRGSLDHYECTFEAWPQGKS